ncbi:type VI secretion system tip protein TssI/VgrG, partial [Mesorhizobium retamae]
SDAGNQFEEHVVIQIVHVARDRSYETNEGDPEYVNRFLAIPSKVPATPHRTVPRPRCEGTQIAIIAGPEGEEIHTDPHGRVKVWFPWDRRARKDGSDTCWIRVAQNWGGAGWGGQIIPRIGMEAVLSHIDGDFDKPLIVGLVPNARQKTPYKLPENKTRSGFKTQTHKGGGFNELSFEDENGKQQVYVHAQKDLDRLVKDNETTTIEKGNRTTTLQQGDEKKTLQQGNRSVTLQTGDEKKTIAQGGLTEQIAKSRSTTANTVYMTAVAGKNGPGIIGHTADDQITLQVGPSKITLTKTNIVIEHAGSSITFDANVINQIAGNIHLNKDKAG